MRTVLSWVLVVALAGVAQAQVQTRTVEYEHDGQRFEGYLAVPEGAGDDDARPGVLVIHEWWGLNEFAKSRARQLAEMGYVALAADMFGEGRSTDDPEQARQWAGGLYQDRERARRRVVAGLEALKDQPAVDDDRLAAIGFCFGGTTALELAYAGADVDGVVSFHGNPKPPMEGDDVDAQVLILHGAADPMVSRESLDAVTDALDAAEVDWTLIAYSDAVHSFTNPEADQRGMDGIGYDRRAAEQSWDHMRVFFEDLFAEE